MWSQLGTRPSLVSKEFVAAFCYSKGEGISPAAEHHGNVWVLHGCREMNAAEISLTKHFASFPK